MFAGCRVSTGPLNSFWDAGGSSLEVSSFSKQAPLPTPTLPLCSHTCTDSQILSYAATYIHVYSVCMYLYMSTYLRIVDIVSVTAKHYTGTCRHGRPSWPGACSRQGSSFVCLGSGPNLSELGFECLK